MRFSVGLWDSLFGEKVTLDIPTEHGDTVKQEVTKRWLASQEQSGKIKVLQTIRVQMLHPSGNRSLDWLDGRDVSQADVDTFRDTGTGELYAMTYFEKGEPKVTVMKRSFWEKARDIMEDAGNCGPGKALEDAGLEKWKPEDFR